MNSKTIAWLNSLPKPGDTEGWAKRQAETFDAIFSASLYRGPAPLANCQLEKISSLGPGADANVECKGARR